jgi:hypothetical protein
MRARTKAKARVNFAAFLKELEQSALFSHVRAISLKDLRVEGLRSVRSKLRTIWYGRQSLYAWLVCGRLV